MLVFLNAFLIDGAGGAPVPGTTVIVDGSIIKRVGQGLAVPEGAQIIDLKGKTLLPGFSDAHTHLGGSISLDRPGAVSRFASYDYAQHREAALRWGVTTLRSAGDFTPDVLEFRDDVNAGLFNSPRILACGRFFQAIGGHPLSTVYSDDLGIEENACVLVDESTDIDTEVGKLHELGVDWIKVIISDDNKFKYPDTKAPCLSDEQLRRISDAAHRRSLPVMAHVDDIGDLVRAVNTGADTIEHTINVATSDHEMTDDVLRLLTDKNVWVVPTLVATKIHDGSVPGASLAWPALLTAAARMIEAGVNIGVGCDSGIPFVPFGECVHTEMELLTQAGYSPLQAITAATGNNAKMLRMSHIFGTIAPDQAADLVILGSNPSEDIRNTKDIRMVLRNGAVVFDNMLA